MDVLYWERPSAAELAGTAYKVTDYVEPHVDVWDENWDVLEIFRMYSSQWRMGPNGPIGLDLNVIHFALDRKGIKGEEFDRMIDDLQLIQGQALAKIRAAK